MTQKKLLDKLHITYQALPGGELGDKEPSLDMIQSMARLFDCTIEELVKEPK